MSAASPSTDRSTGQVNLRSLAEKALSNHKYLERFLAKVEVLDSGCWQWTASTSGHKGRMYGCFWNGKIIKAHQFAAETWIGPRDGRIVCHHCDNPLCVNPSHLYLGTAKDNVLDAVKRGRHSNGKSRLTHCPQGHPYSGANLYVPPGSQQRICRTCRDIHRGRTPKAYF